MSIFNPHVYGTSIFARLVVTFGLVSLGGASPQVTAQAPAPPPAAAPSATTPPPTIEVASIKRNREESRKIEAEQKELRRQLDEDIRRMFSR